MVGRPPIDLLGSYVEAPPRDVALRGTETGSTVLVVEEDLHLETGVTGPSARTVRRRSLTGVGSLIAHAAGLVAVFAVPLILSSNLPEPAYAVQDFLFEPLTFPPPPPPPPPAPRGALVRSREKAAPVPAAEFVAPVAIPVALVPEETLDLGDTGGVDGGVAGGVPGGVVGAIVGGLPDAVAEPPPAVGPIRVGGLVREPLKIKHVSPVYPEVALAARVESSVQVEALIDVKGRVVEVRALHGQPLFCEAAIEAVRQWTYTPTLLDGVPTPVLMTITVHFRLQPGRRATR